ncbi:orotidine-5'-phosphate decarboxylase [Subtercola sp. YIM 133946]|uniref:orotidine-5'-phosphate decarboxylase n=1 Tax=Subtercola sp. YIM 133946 TaxID=3118909 RepID=UPI003FCCC1F8
MGFGVRLADTFAARGQLCVGVDPHDYLLDAWNLPRSAAGVREFGLRVVDAAAGWVGILKPQVAFYELYGAAGYAALEEVLAAGRAAGLLVIADAKRGDIGTSAEAYGRAWLLPGSPLEADAVTLTAYAGVGSLTAVFDLAVGAGKGAFVLSATSNPESFALQTARVAVGGRGHGRTASADDGGTAGHPGGTGRHPGGTGRHPGGIGGHPGGIGGPPADDDLSLAGLVASEVSTFNGSRRGDVAALGNIGLVLGATKNLLDYGIDRDQLAAAPSTPVLAPGFGFQGARFGDVRRVFGALTPSTVVAVSRSVLQSGPEGLVQSIRQQADELAEALAAAA